MKTNIIIPAALYIPLLIIQLTIVPFVSIDFISPDLILILLLYYTLLNGQLYGTITGAVFGLLFDLISGGLIGSSMFSKTLAGFIAGYFYNENKLESNVSSLNFVYIVLLCAFIDSFFYNIFSGAESDSFLFLIINKGILPAVYTAIVSLILIVVKPKRINL